MSTSPDDFNQQVIAEFRSNRGRVEGAFAGGSLLLLHHVGARSGTSYVTPLAYLEDDGRYVVLASKAGAPENPGWYHNLRAQPRVTLEIGGETIEATATEATGAERDRLFAAVAEHSPQFGAYQDRTERIIPVIVLTPDGR